jgi:hypothetical protein
MTHSVLDVVALLEFPRASLERERNSRRHIARREVIFV